MTSTKALIDTAAGASKDTLNPREVLAAFAPSAGLQSKPASFEYKTSFAKSLQAQPFMMAPMAGVSDGAYRMMARAGGAHLAYSEMVSVTGLCYNQEKTWELALPAQGEGELAVQLFGAEPKQFYEAARALFERMGKTLVLIDINMACPVPKVTKKGEGSALLDSPALAAKIVEACIKATEGRLPVTAKLRRGRTQEVEQAPCVAQALEAAGAAAVTVHGRSASQLYRGNADWGAITRVAEAVSIPVIGTGDVSSAERAVALLSTTGATAALIARGSYGNPWIFKEAQELFEGRKPTLPTLEQKIAAFTCHLYLLQATGAHLARARSLAGWYLRGLPHAAFWRNEAMKCSSFEDYQVYVDRLMQAIAKNSLQENACGSS